MKKRYLFVTLALGLCLTWALLGIFGEQESSAVAAPLAPESGGDWDGSRVGVLMVISSTGLGQAQGSIEPQAALGTAFTYQGRLTDGGSPANGTYDFQFKLYDAVTGGAQAGSTITKEDVAVVDGYFTVELDFGDVFDGTALWLEVGVRAGASIGAFTTLLPRQALTATPYALYTKSVPSHDHLGQTWTGSNNPLVITGTFGSAPLVLANTSGSGLLVDSAGGEGVHVKSSGGDGLHVNSAGDDGLDVDSAGDKGVVVNSAGGDGVVVDSAGGSGVVVRWTAGDGVRVDSAGGNAGQFNGDVNITGNLSKGGGGFKIDHPLDPENKYLYHSFVESPDMMNVYNGNVILGEKGEAWVELPEWFEALNRDFRYQLTCIGGFAPVYIAAEIEDNRFKIAGGRPGVKVSWQVTGIRQDAYAEANRVPVEEEKPAEEQGTYRHPEARGLPETAGLAYREAQAHKNPSQSSEVTP